MTIRGKLNLAVSALIAIFLVAAAFSLHAVRESAESTQAYLQTRQLTQLISDIRTDIYQHLAEAGGSIPLLEEPELVGWPGYALNDIDVQIRLAEGDRERTLWQGVRQAVETLGGAGADRPTAGELPAALRLAERSMRELRGRYDSAEFSLIAKTANAAYAAQQAITIACLLTVFLFLAYVVMVRAWLVNPIQVLKASADRIGAGDLDHRVPLRGHNELADLAKRLDAMAGGLAKHQAELLEARELSAIGELCTNVAHGLKNPLAAIRATAQLAHRRVALQAAANQSEDAGKIQSMISDVIQQSDRMNERITRLFDFSRPNELRRECATFSELAAAARAEAHPLLDTRGVRLTIEDQCDDEVWCFDREQMAGALAEVVSNAVHHSSDGDEVILRGRSVRAAGGETEHLEILVVDHGAGMPPATLEKVFNLFFTSRAEGSGMGLAMVRRTINRHGGEIRLASKLGEGTTATISVPQACPHCDPVERAQCQQQARVRAQRAAGIERVRHV